MSKFAKYIFIVLIINILLLSFQSAEISLDDMEIKIEDHSKDQVDEKIIRDSIKLEYINKEEDEKKKAETEKINNKNANANGDTGSSQSSEHKDQAEQEQKKSSSGLDPSIFEEIKGAYRIRSEDELKYLLELSDLTFLKFSYMKNSKNSISIAKHIKSLSDKLNYLAGIILIDCETFTPHHYDDCQVNDYLNDSFPKIKLLIPPEKRYDAVLDAWETHFEIPWTEKEMTENTIYNYVVSNIPNKALKIDINTSYGFFESNTMNKIILFTDKASPTLLFKGLTNYFYDKIAFGYIKIDQEELIKKFNVKKFPTLILYKVIDRSRLLDEPEIITYEGLTKAEKLVEFIEPHTLPEKFHYRQRRGIIEHDIREMSKHIRFNELNTKNYESIFEKYGEKNIVVYFDKKFRMKNAFKQFLIKNHGFFHTYYFDCSNFKKFCLEKFGVEKFPSLKLFQTNTTIVEEKVNTHKNLPYANAEISDLKVFLNTTYAPNYQNLSNIEFAYFMTEAKFNKKYVIGYFSENQEEDELESFALLSTDKKLAETFEFVYLNKPEYDNRKKYKIFNSPAIYLFFDRKDEFKTIMIPTNSLYETLRTVSYSLDYYKHQKLVIKNYFSEFIPQIEDNFGLRKNCLELNECVLFLFPANNDQARIDEFDFMMRKLENVRNKPFLEKIKFGWLNVTCHKDILDRMEIKHENIPGIVYLFPWRTAYAYYNNYFEDFPLTEFFEKAIQGRTTNTYIKRDQIYLSNKNCDDPEHENDISLDDTEPAVVKGEIINEETKSPKSEEMNLDDKRQEENIQIQNDNSDAKSSNDNNAAKKSDL